MEHTYGQWRDQHGDGAGARSARPHMSGAPPLLARSLGWRRIAGRVVARRGKARAPEDARGRAPHRAIRAPTDDSDAASRELPHLRFSSSSFPNCRNASRARSSGARDRRRARTLVETRASAAGRRRRRRRSPPATAPRARARPRRPRRARAGRARAARALAARARARSWACATSWDMGARGDRERAACGYDETSPQDADVALSTEDCGTGAPRGRPSGRRPHAANRVELEARARDAAAALWSSRESPARGVPGGPPHGGRRGGAAGRRRPSARDADARCRRVVGDPRLLGRGRGQRGDRGGPVVGRRGRANCSAAATSAAGRGSAARTRLPRANGGDARRRGRAGATGRRRRSTSGATPGGGASGGGGAAPGRRRVGRGVVIVGLVGGAVGASSKSSSSAVDPAGSARAASPPRRRGTAAAPRADGAFSAAARRPLGRAPQAGSRARLGVGLGLAARGAHRARARSSALRPPAGGRVQARARVEQRLERARQPAPRGDVRGRRARERLRGGGLRRRRPRRRRRRRRRAPLRRTVWNPPSPGPAPRRGARPP